MSINYNTFNKGVNEIDHQNSDINLSYNEDEVSEINQSCTQKLVNEDSLYLNDNKERLRKKQLLDIKCECQYKLLNLKMQEMLIITRLTQIKQVIKNNNNKIHLIQSIKTLSRSFDPYIFTTQLSKAYKTVEEMSEKDVTVVRALRNLQYQLHKFNHFSF